MGQAVPLVKANGETPWLNEKLIAPFAHPNPRKTEPDFPSRNVNPCRVIW